MCCPAIPTTTSSILVPEEDREKYPIPGKEGEFMKFRMDMDNMRVFPEREYIDALSHVGIIPEQVGILIKVSYNKVY